MLFIAKVMKTTVLLRNSWRFVVEEGQVRCFPMADWTVADLRGDDTESLRGVFVKHADCLVKREGKMAQSLTSDPFSLASFSLSPRSRSKNLADDQVRILQRPQDFIFLSRPGLGR